MTALVIDYGFSSYFCKGCKKSIILMLMDDSIHGKICKLAATNHFTEVIRIPAQGKILVLSCLILCFLRAMAESDQFPPSLVHLQLSLETQNQWHRGKIGWTRDQHITLGEKYKTLAITALQRHHKRKDKTSLYIYHKTWAITALQSKRNRRNSRNIPSSFACQ